MLLLNVGPKPDGTITAEETAVLEEIGEWLKVNGEGIYGTVPWKQFGEGSVNNVAGSFMDNDEKDFTCRDYRFTSKDGCLYAFCMKPESAEFCIRSLVTSEIDSVEVLGCYSVAEFSRGEEGLEIVIDKAPISDKPICFKVRFALGV